MDFIGNVKSISKSFSGGVDILINLDTENPSEGLLGLLNERIRIKLSKYYKPRSNDANAYYWELLHQLASKKKDCGEMVSVPYLHNYYLRQVGIVDRDSREKKGDYTITTYLPNTDEVQKEVDEDVYNHFLPTSNLQVDKNGNVVRGYILLKGSHEYDSKQFSMLIGFLVEDCKTYGIETLTPKELELMCSVIKTK